jgi:hypothetical protein
LDANGKYPYNHDSIKAYYFTSSKYKSNFQRCNEVGHATGQLSCVIYADTAAAKDTATATKYKPKPNATSRPNSNCKYKPNETARKIVLTTIPKVRYDEIVLEISVATW